MTPRHPIRTLAAKELSILLNAPATYVIFFLFLLITGYLFVAPLFSVGVSTLDSFLRPLPLIFTFTIPALTMRSFSEEYRAGTIEYLSTLPLRDYEIVLGKYVAALGLIGALLAFTLIYPLILLIVGRPDIGQLVGAYASIIGLVVFYAAIGVWASSVTRNQVVAFIIGFFVCFLFFLLGRVAEMVPGVFAAFLRGWAVETHFDALARGVLDTRDLIYWASGATFFLAACLASLNARRWR